MCVLKALRLKGTGRINAIGLIAAIEIQAFFIGKFTGLLTDCNFSTAIKTVSQVSGNLVENFHFHEFSFSCMLVSGSGYRPLGKPLCFVGD